MEFITNSPHIVTEKGDKIVYPFGPPIFQTHVDKNFTKELIEEGRKLNIQEDDWNPRLAGNLKYGRSFHYKKYYLLKADTVVAVEANPRLCQIIKNKFDKEIFKKNLIVENIAITNKIDNLNDSFYVHKYHDLLGQYPKPIEKIDDFDSVAIQSKDIISLIKNSGEILHFVVSHKETGNLSVFE